MLIVINGTFFVQMLMVGLQWGPSCRGRKWVLNYIKPTFDNTVIVLLSCKLTLFYRKYIFIGKPWVREYFGHMCNLLELIVPSCLSPAVSTQDVLW